MIDTATTKDSGYERLKSLFLTVIYRIRAIKSDHNLSKDLAAILTLLFLIITYHMLHPTMLFRVQFGETFRDVNQEGFQEAMVVGLLVSALLLIGSWRTLWADRNEASGRLRIALVLGGLGLYVLHNLAVEGMLVFTTSIVVGNPLFWLIAFLLLARVQARSRQKWRHVLLALFGIIFGAELLYALGYQMFHITFAWRDYNIFLEIFDVNLEVFVDELQMRRSEASIFAPPITALNTYALLGGVGLASIIVLWAPWNIPDKTKSSQLTNYWTRFAVGISAIAFWYMTYHAVSPLWRTHEGQSLSDYALLLTIGLLVSVLFLIESPSELLKGWRHRSGRLSIVILIGIGLFILHALVVSIADYDVIADYHSFEASAMDDLLAQANMVNHLKVTDRSALLAGIAFISIFYLWAPWERLVLYFTLLRDNLSAILVAVFAVFAWQQAIDIFKIEQFLLPKPTAIWETFKEIYPAVIAGAWFTVKNAIKGFLFGCGAGILTGTISARFIRFSKAILPIAVAANAVPIIAFAPIANASFGLTSSTSKVIIVALLCYFPAMISTVQGLTSVESRQLELMRSYAASELEIFRYVRVPNALPFIFSALKLAATLAMIGAIVAEFFGGTPFTALGFSIKNDAALLKMTESWSRIIVASVLGIGFYLLISVLEFNAMPWHGSFRSESR